MEIHLKINDVRGQDEKGRHILWINDEDLRLWLEEHPQYVLQTIVQPMLKHHPGKLQEIIDDPQIRNVIYMKEKAAREQKAANPSKVPTRRTTATLTSVTPSAVSSKNIVRTAPSATYSPR